VHFHGGDREQLLDTLYTVRYKALRLL
jgi:hypothetical protein